MGLEIKAMDSQEILSLAIPAIATFLAGLASSFLPKLLNRKYAQIIMKVLCVLYPVLADNTKYLGGYGVRKIIGDTIASIDKNLTQPEIGKITELTLKKYDPAIAANKPETLYSQAVSKAIVRTDGDISALDLSHIRWNFSIGRD